MHKFVKQELSRQAQILRKNGTRMLADADQYQDDGDLETAEVLRLLADETLHLATKYETHNQ